MDLVKCFENIRDIPYRIPLSSKERDDTCSGKSEKLLKILKDNGYKVRYRVCMFLWNDLSLPKEIKKPPHDKKCTHVYLEVYIKDKWKILDATWDKRLKRVFYINKWDGRSDTKVAVRSIKTFSPKKSLALINEQSKEYLDEDLRRNGKFYKALNLWFVKVRKMVNK